jgi:hypothetical protein
VLLEIVKPSAPHLLSLAASDFPELDNRNKPEHRDETIPAL